MSYSWFERCKTYHNTKVSICEAPSGKIHICFYDYIVKKLITVALLSHIESICSQESHPMPEHTLLGVTKALLSWDRPVTLFWLFSQPSSSPYSWVNDVENHKAALSDKKAEKVA